MLKNASIFKTPQVEQPNVKDMLPNQLMIDHTIRSYAMHLARRRRVRKCECHQQKSITSQGPFRCGKGYSFPDIAYIMQLPQIINEPRMVPKPFINDKLETLFESTTRTAQNSEKIDLAKRSLGPIRTESDSGSCLDPILVSPRISNVSYKAFICSQIIQRYRTDGALTHLRLSFVLTAFMPRSTA